MDFIWFYVAFIWFVTKIEKVKNICSHFWYFFDSIKYFWPWNIDTHIQKINLLQRKIQEASFHKMSKVNAAWVISNTRRHKPSLALEPNVNSASDAYTSCIENNSEDQGHRVKLDNHIEATKLSIRCNRSDTHMTTKNTTFRSIFLT